MKHLKFMLAILMMLLVVILIVQNHEAMSKEVSFRADFRLFQLESSMISLYSIITIAFLFGVLIMGLFGIVERYRLKKQIKMLLSTTAEKDQELNSLRNLPITSDDVNSSQENENL